MAKSSVDSFAKLGQVWPKNLTVNQLVVGSIPTVGAKSSIDFSYLQKARASGLFPFLSGGTLGEQISYPSRSARAMSKSS